MSSFPPRCGYTVLGSLNSCVYTGRGRLLLPSVLLIPLVSLLRPLMPPNLSTLTWKVSLIPRESLH